MTGGYSREGTLSTIRPTFGGWSVSSPSRLSVRTGVPVGTSDPMSTKGFVHLSHFPLCQGIPLSSPKLIFFPLTHTMSGVAGARRLKTSCEGQHRLGSKATNVEFSVLSPLPSITFLFVQITLSVGWLYYLIGGLHNYGRTQFRYV